MERMKIVLVRHGEAESSTDDHSRELTEKGRSDIHRIGKILKSTGWNFTRIYCSPLVRTTQTAEILSGELSEGAIAAESTPILKPGLSPESIGDLFDGVGSSDGIVLVFHMPDVARVASYFMGLPESSFYITPGTLLSMNVPVHSYHLRSMLISCIQPEFLKEQNKSKKQEIV